MVLAVSPHPGLHDWHRHHGCTILSAQALFQKFVRIRRRSGASMATLIRRVLKGSLAAGVGLGFLSIVLIVGGLVWLQGSLPTVDGERTVFGMVQPVRVVRDRQAVPHIFAASLEDATRALGVVHAQDRLFQMDLMRRLGAGRLSEITGTLIGDLPLRVDKAMRAFGLYRAAANSLAALSEDARGLLRAYAEGVNSVLVAPDGPWPIEFQVLAYRPEPWQPADSLVWGKLMALQLSGNLWDELRRARLMAVLPPEQVGDLIDPSVPSGPTSLSDALDPVRLSRLAAVVETGLDGLMAHASASNAWAVAGRQTESGAPLLANDPHLRLEAPVLWYLARLETPDVSLVGATVPGVPAMVLGHNGWIAWGLTTPHSDTQDLFVERLAPDASDHYLTPAGAIPFETRAERIRVRFSEDRLLTVRATRHGPVLSDLGWDLAAASLDDGEVLSLAFTGFGSADTTAEALFRLNRARGWQDFVEALRAYQTPHQNILYAGRDGTIGLVSPGLVPIRRQGDGRLPVPGWTGDHDWIGTIPFDQLPRTVNPASGWVINANNPVIGAEGGRALGVSGQPAYRARRIEGWLGRPGRRSLEDSLALQMDTVSPAALDLLPSLLAVTVPPGSRAAAARARLAAWDGRMNRDSAAALIYQTWLETLAGALFGAAFTKAGIEWWRVDVRSVRLALDSGLGRRGSTWCRQSASSLSTVDESGPLPLCAEVLSESLTKAVVLLTDQYGDDMDRWRWGQAHRAALAHPLFGRIPGLKALINADIATDGGPYTVNRGSHRYSSRTVRFDHVHGAGLRVVYDLADLGRSRFMIATGQSGNPLSPHFRDLSFDWRNGRSFRLDGAADVVAADGLGTLWLVPTSSATALSPPALSRMAD